MKTCILIFMGMSSLLAACGPTRTILPGPATLPQSPTPVPTFPPTRWPSVTPWPTRRPTRTPQPQRTQPIPRPGPTVPRDPLTFILTFTTTGELSEEQTFQGYTIRIYTERTDVHCCGQAVEILHGVQRVFADRGFGFLLGWYDKEEGFRRIAMGQDVTGDGIPDLVLRYYSGGAHCCTTYYVFELGPEFRQIGTIEAGRYDSQIADLDADGNWEFIVHDWAYACCGPWPEAGIPGPYVALHYVDGGYHLAYEAMRKPAPSAEELKALAQKYASIAARGGHPEDDGRFWEDAVGLVYSGHPEMLEPFLEVVWPNDPDERKGFLELLLQLMQDSLYWPEIKDLSTQWPWPEQ